MTLNVHIITPGQIIWDGPSSEVILPCKTGQMGILTGHIALTTIIDIGILRIRFNKVWIPIFVTAGFASVENDELTVLINTAQRGDKIDTERAKADLEAAQIRLSQAEKLPEKMLANKSIKKALARLTAAAEFPPQVQIPAEYNGAGRKKAQMSAMQMLQNL